MQRLGKQISSFAAFIYDYVVSSFNDSHTSQQSSYALMRKCYSLSRGKSAQALSWVPRLLSPPKTRANVNTLHILNALNNQGYYKNSRPSGRINALCQNLRRDLSTCPIYEVLEDFEPGHKYASFDEALADSSRTCVRLNHHRKDVAHSINTWEIISELNMVDIADLYLGCDPILTSVDSWYVVPINKDKGSSGIYSAAAQTFHYDMDWIKFIKFFVNLTDVGECHGPFEFVSDSHRVKNNGYYKDVRFESLLDHSALIKATGPAGSVFMADTAGIHRDGRATSGFRHVLQVEFAISCFGAKFQYDELYKQCRMSVPWDKLPPKLARRKRLLRLLHSA